MFQNKVWEMKQRGEKMEKENEAERRRERANLQLYAYFILSLKVADVRC